MNNRKWLIVIAVILVGIFIILLMGATEKTQGEKIGDSIGEIIDSAGDGVREFGDNVSDGIDEHTTNRR